MIILTPWTLLITHLLYAFCTYHIRYTPLSLVTTTTKKISFTMTMTIFARYKNVCSINETVLAEQISLVRSCQ